LPAASAIPVTTPLVPLEAAELVLDVVEPLPLELVPALLLLLNELPPLAPESALRDGLGVGVGLGLAVTVKLAALVALPTGVATVSGPLVARKGTVAVSCVSLFTVKRAARPLKETVVAPVKPLPTRVTLLPVGPEVGIMAVIVGAGAGDAVSSATIALSTVMGAVANVW
jgi:hypothetical protein